MSSLPRNHSWQSLVDKETQQCSSIRGIGTKLLWKSLLCISIVGMLIYFMLIWTSAMTLKEHDQPIHETKEKLTIVMNTFKRLEMMEGSVNHYSKCNIVKYIHIIWSEKELPPERVTAKYSSRNHPKIVFSIQSQDSLNNRFKPLSGEHTDAIFAVDDDMRVPCADLELGFETWQNSRRNLVGYMPRLHLRGKHGLVYACWWRVWWHGAYSIILTKAAFLHHDYFNIYTNVMPQAVRDLVDKRRNCEDIAMQFLIANASSLPPIYVKGHLDDLGAYRGISTNKSIIMAAHMDERSLCLNDLTTLFGHMPLITSHAIVDSAANGWSHSPSTWYEYISSDLWRFQW